MKIGIVTKWFNSGQAVVSRHIRSALVELGHEVFILARQGTGPRSQMESDRVEDPVWEVPGITEVTESDVPLETFESFVREANVAA